MSGKRREHVMSRSEQASRGLALCDGLAREPPMSPIPIPLALGAPLPSAPAVHPATGLAGDLERTAGRTGTGSRAALNAHGVVFHFPHRANDGLPAFAHVHMLDNKPVARRRVEAGRELPLARHRCATTSRRASRIPEASA